MGDDFFYDLGFILMMDEIEKRRVPGRRDEAEGEVFVAEDEEY